MDLPMRLHIHAMPDDPHLQAVLYGPLVLAGGLGAAGVTRETLVGSGGPLGRRCPMDVPAFRAAGEDPASWIKRDDKPLTFRTTNQAKDVTLQPFNSIFDK